jgi:hypothetical protein
LLADGQQAVLLGRHGHAGARVVWITHCASARASCTALWMTKPAGFTGKGESMSLLQPRSTLISEEAVISSNISP